jgi:hypothetical protein
VHLFCVELRFSADFRGNIINLWIRHFPFQS